ncbi:hypothetical protein [Burkholderia gladioli]|uniref:hypothetical protein n=1 Tax=Burkholderia gladioli TaxID=28095 RepID=UPI00163F9C5F|nr:hypothetical protein [Burkholderia gladioli]
MWLSLHAISAKESITEIVQRNDRAEIFPRRAQKMLPPRIGTWHPVIAGSANGVASEINFSPGRTWIQPSPGFLIRIPSAASTRSPMRATSGYRFVQDHEGESGSSQHCHDEYERASVDGCDFGDVMKRNTRRRGAASRAIGAITAPT